MTPARFRDLEQAFLRLLEIEPDTRSAALEQLAASDPELHREVEHLLAAHEQAAGFLESPADPALAPPSPLPCLPERVGPYRVLECIGEGGMGAVYLAVRDDGTYQRRVAIKFFRLGIENRSLLQRFYAERQILASLDHPSIAKLHDADSTETGVPYLVMEHVEGLPIDQYADRERLDLAGRIALFRKVCAAVSYAHANLVVHRDIKPSNILVRNDGEPKLLDFGISKLLNPALSQMLGDPTRFDAQLMTPDYASPEQIQGAPVTTASDVYSLGILLYRLLAGRSPYHLERLTLAERLRTVCEEEPQRPSALVRSLATTSEASEELAQVCTSRSTSAAQLERQLRGDLDNVVLKALRKEPNRRYSSVEQLAEDLGRHLRGFPVLARPDTLGYRSAKFVRRHRLGVAFAALFVLVVLGFAASTAFQSRELRRSLERTEEEAAKATAVARFLEQSFSSADPFSGGAREVTVAQALDRALTRVEGDFAGQPSTEAVVRSVIGRTLSGLGRHDDAMAQLERALATRQKLYGDEHPEVTESHHSLAVTLRQLGKYEAAEQHARRALELRERLLGERDPETAKSAAELAEVLWLMGRYDEAEAQARRGLALRLELFGRESAETAESLALLAAVRHSQGAYDEAEGLCREALALRRRILGNDHPDVAITLIRLSSVLRDKEEDAAAELPAREALELRQRVLGPDHPQTALAYSDLAGVRRALGDLAGAEELYRRAIAGQHKSLGEEHPMIAVTLSNLGTLFLDQGNFAAAAEHFEAALAMERRLVGAEHPSVAIGLNNLAAVVYRQGDLEGSERLLAEALELRRKHVGNQHPDVALSITNLATVMAQRGKFEEAERLFREALAIRERALGADDPTLALTLNNLGALLRDKGDCAAALPVLERAILLQDPASGRTWRIAETQRHYGTCLLELERYDEAEEQLRAAWAGLAAAPPSERYRAEETAAALLRLYTVRGREQEAAEVRAALAALR